MSFNEDDQERFVKACKEDDVSTVQTLIGGGTVEVNRAGEYGRTPLHLVSRYNSATLAEVLLHAGANPEVKDCNGTTPLHFTALGNNTAVTKALLQADASPHVKTNRGDTPLHYAARENSIAVAEVLLNAGASQHMKNNLVQTPLDMASGEQMKKFLMNWEQEKATSEKSKFEEDPPKPKHQAQLNEATYSVGSSPEIFISYQWDKKPQVKALYDVLSSRGYSCWIDQGQMGGGDSLYGEIDKGIRGCKVMLSCVTAKYSQSVNCQREVSLADNCKKPIIPLLLEKPEKWPPEGPMGMVFTQLLYINFYKPNVSIQNDWKCDQMDDLIKQIKRHLKTTKETKLKG